MRQYHKILECRILDNCTQRHVTVQDELWMSEWLPFLFFGKHNVDLFNVSSRQPRRMMFVRIGWAVWLTHLTLLKSGDISRGESDCMRSLLEDYIVNTYEYTAAI
tara:strand:- start:32 stop:346 length:315 start_codon:yes stop_codon:yes gene_type:complete